jgi:hypothetical protein
MHKETLQPIATVRQYRTIPKLIIEWILGLTAFFSIVFGVLGLAAPMRALPSILIGAASAYGLTRLRERWSRVPVTVYSGGHVSIGREVITRERVAGLEIVDHRAEPGLIIGTHVLSYVNVVEVFLRLSDGTTRRLRLLEKDYRTVASLFGREDTTAAEAS